MSRVKAENLSKFRKRLHDPEQISIDIVSRENRVQFEHARIVLIFELNTAIVRYTPIVDRMLRFSEFSDKNINNSSERVVYIS